MRHLTAAAFVVWMGLVGPTLRAQAPIDSFDSTNPITLRGTLVGIAPYSGVEGVEHLLVFEAANRAGRREQWATRVDGPVAVARGEAIVVVGYRPATGVSVARLLPFGAVPMLAPLATARRVLRATDIRRLDGSVLVAPR